MKKTHFYNCMTAFICFIAISVALPFTKAEARTTTQDALHDIADICRDLGFDDNHKILKSLQELWWEEEMDVEILTTLIFNEGKYGPDRLQELDGAVAVNRMESDLFPNTMYEVVTQPGQYLKAYATPGSYYWNLARVDTSEYLRCRAAAEKALNGKVDCPANVVWQANFRQGDDIYETVVVDTPNFKSTTYFCTDDRIPVE